MSLFGSVNVDKLVEKKDIQGLLKLLKHRKEEKVKKAIIALGELGAKEAFIPIVSILKEHNQRWHLQEVLITLRKLKANDSVKELIDEHGDSLLKDVVISGKIELLKLLIENGVNVNVKDDQGFTALQHAVTPGNVKIVKLLLDSGADVNAQNNSGSTALMIAAALCKAEIVKLLLASGANAKIKNNSGNNALDAALRMGQIRIFGGDKNVFYGMLDTLMKAGAKISLTSLPPEIRKELEKRSKK